MLLIYGMHLCTVYILAIVMYAMCVKSVSIRCVLLCELSDEMMGNHTHTCLHLPLCVRTGSLGFRQLKMPSTPQCITDCSLWTVQTEAQLPAPILRACNHRIGLHTNVYTQVSCFPLSSHIHTSRHWLRCIMPHQLPPSQIKSSGKKRLEWKLDFGNYIWLTCRLTERKTC